MAIVAAKVAVITVNNAGTAVGSAYTGAIGELRSYNVEESANLMEVTKLSDANRKYTDGMPSWTATINAYFDASDSIGTLKAGDKKAFWVFAGAAASTSKYQGGDAYITSYTASADIDGVIEVNMTIQGDTTLARG